MMKELRIPVFVKSGDRILGYTIYSTKSGGSTTMLDELTGGWSIFLDGGNYYINEMPLAIGCYLQVMFQGKDDRIFNITHDNGPEEVYYILKFYPDTESARLLYSLPEKK